MDGAVMRKNRMLGILEAMGNLKTYSVQELKTMVQRKFGYREETAELMVRDMIRIGILKCIRADRYGANPQGWST